MSETLYAKIVRELSDGIASGRHPVGSLLPSEQALGQQFSASRHTVRFALAQLAELGLITRLKGIGSRVEPMAQATAYSHSLSSLEDLEQHAETNLRVLRKIEETVIDRALAKELGCAPGSRWLQISTLRLTSKSSAVPVCCTDIYVDTAYTDLKATIKRRPTVLISDVIEKRYGRRCNEVRQTISACLVTPALSAILDVAAGSPALKIRRWYFDARGEAIEMSLSTYPAERFDFSMVLKRERPAAGARTTPRPAS